MRAFAEFIMRGQLQAVLVAMLAMASLLLAWVGAAAVTLVVLRHGIKAAVPVFLAALLPAGFWSLAGDAGPLITLTSVMVLALVLRVSRSWSMVLTLAPFVLGAWCLAILAVVPDYVEAIRLLLEQTINSVKSSMADSASAAELALIEQIEVPSAMQIVSMLAILQLLMTVLSLLLARWWQAILYNPGGFQQEFHVLKLERLHALILVAGVVLTATRPDLGLWAWVFIMPMMLAGVAMVHGIVALKHLPAHWLVLFYVSLLVARPIMPLLAAAAIADSALDFRGRLKF